MPPLSRRHGRAPTRRGSNCDRCQAKKVAGTEAILWRCCGGHEQGNGTDASRLICIAVALTAAACGGPGGSLTDQDLSAGQVSSASYRLAPGDKIKVNVFNEPDFSGEFQVSDSGSVAFPLVGEVPAAGASLAEFGARLVQRLRGGFVRNPRVSVEVSNYRPVNVLGEVGNTSGRLARRKSHPRQLVAGLHRTGSRAGNRCAPASKPIWLSFRHRAPTGGRLRPQQRLPLRLSAGQRTRGVSASRSFRLCH
jgi:hypothetical protein